MHGTLHIQLNLWALVGAGTYSEDLGLTTYPGGLSQRYQPGLANGEAYTYGSSAEGEMWFTSPTNLWESGGKVDMDYIFGTPLKLNLQANARAGVTSDTNVFWSVFTFSNAGISWGGATVTDANGNPVPLAFGGLLGGGVVSLAAAEDAAVLTTDSGLDLRYAVDVPDLQSWAVTIPEPVTGVLVALSLLGLVCLRKRVVTLS